MDKHVLIKAARRGTLGFALGLLLAGCGSKVDLSAVDAERKHPLQRYDIVQTLAGNDKVLVAGTQDGALLLSADQGKTWVRQQLPGASLTGLTTCPDGSFVAIDFYHKVWRANADGSSWQSSNLDKPRTPLTVSCDAKGHWWVAGSGARIATSADQGASWQVTDLGEDVQLTTLQMVDADFGIAMGEFGTVLTTKDGGKSWQKGPAIPNDYYPYATLFVDRKEGWSSGLAGQMLHTTDGGVTWSKAENAAKAPLYRLFLHHGRPYGVGAGGVVARLDGKVWRAMPYADAAPVFLAAGASVKQQAALAIGGPGGLLRVIGTQTN